MTVQHSILGLARAGSSLLLALTLLLSNGMLSAALAAIPNASPSMRCCRTKKPCCCRKKSAANSPSVSARSCPDHCSLPATLSSTTLLALLAAVLPVLAGFASLGLMIRLATSKGTPAWRCYSLRQRPPPPRFASALC